MSYDAKVLKESTKELSVLVVDDDQSIRLMFEQLFNSLFREVQVAKNGQEALDYLQAQGPGMVDLVVTDIQMPVMDGLKLSKSIREWYPPQKIIMVSAHNEPRFLVQAIEIGVDGFIVKPVQIQQLFATLQRITASLRHAVENKRYQSYLEEERAIVAGLMDRMMRQEWLSDPAVEWLLRPSHMVGGDMIAIYRNQQDQLYAMLADSTGHGLPSAINLVPIHRIFYSMAQKGFSLPPMINEIHKGLCSQSTPDRFVAATLVMFDFRCNLLEIWNGGNPAALLLNRSGQLLREFFPKNLPLGIDHGGFSCSTECYILEEPCDLVITSDGILDAESPTGEHFESSRLLSGLLTEDASSLAPDFSHVIRVLDEHLQGLSPEDDISLLRIRSHTGGFNHS